MKHITEDIEEHVSILQDSPNDKEALAATMLTDLLAERVELLNDRNRRHEPIIIEYFVRESYGRKLEYILDEKQRKLVQNLTRQKTIDPIIRELLRDLTESHIIWKQVLAP